MKSNRNSSIIVLRTHVEPSKDPAIAELLEKLRDDCGYHRTYVMLDNTRGIISDDKRVDETTFVVTDRDCIKVNSMHDKGYNGGHTHVSWMFWHPETSFVLCHDWLRVKEREGMCPPFEHVWFVEYDVRCAGNFSKAFAVCDEIHADFMACGTSEGGDKLRLAKYEPGWCWFPRLDGDIAERVTHHDRVGAFFPMVRMSSRMAETIRSEFGKSTGFCEVYVPTLAATTHGLVARAMPASVLGRFRYTPNISRTEWASIDEGARAKNYAEPPRFYHPIK